MIDNLRSLHKDYEQYLVALQGEKKACKKFLNKIETLAQKNKELGIEIDVEEQMLLKEIELEKINKDIVKVKKVIHRLGLCIDIMLDGEINEEPSEVITE